jgi:hypothetical protein
MSKNPPQPSAPVQISFSPQGLQQVAKSVESLAEYVMRELAKRPIRVEPPAEQVSPDA